MYPRESFPGLPAVFPQNCLFACGADLKNRFSLFTSGGLLFPGGVYLGRVRKTYPKESFMNFITADITPAVNVNNLKEVFVLSPPKADGIKGS